MSSRVSAARISATWLAATSTCLLACSSPSSAIPDAPSVAPPVDAPPAAVRVTITDLVKDVASPGVTTDAQLVNPWGVAFAPTGAIWIADNHTGLATVYAGSGATIPLVVTIPPPPGGAGPAAPTGQVFNATATDFLGDAFILSTEDGTIVGWQAGTSAVLRADHSASGAVYKGFDILDTGAGRVICAANFSKGTVDVFDATYHATTLPGGNFTDPSPMAGFAPFNVLVDGTTVYVAYAKQDDQMHDDMSGPGNGAINVFDNTGKFVRRLITGGVLNSPWAMALAPADYPTIGGSLLVGNFGDGRISAIDVASGSLRTQLDDKATGAPLGIPGLWALRFGHDQTGESHQQMFFTAGPAMESHGVLGRLDVAP